MLEVLLWQVGRVEVVLVSDAGRRLFKQGLGVLLAGVCAASLTISDLAKVCIVACTCGACVCCICVARVRCCWERPQGMCTAGVCGYGCAGLT
jgi:hypothetical protein